MLYTSALPAALLTNTRVIVRADLNVPISNGEIIDDYRLKALQPTIDLIREKQGFITLLTHIGRPSAPDPALSTKILYDWFIRHHYPVSWAPDIEHARLLVNQQEHPIILLENIRFYSEEKNHDIDFAKKLKTLGDYFVNDAFGALHRDDTSMTLLPSLFAPDKRTIGLLVEKELRSLKPLIDNPPKPFVIILGGGKVKDKLPVIERFLSIAQHILLCPALSNTFAQAIDQEIGASLIDESAIPLCKKIIQNAKDAGTSIGYPQDYLIAHGSKNGRLAFANSNHFPHDGIALSIGPHSTQEYKNIIGQARTIFFNAAMGFWEIPESRQATRELLQAIANSPAYSVVGGGDSVAAAQEAGLQKSISFFSTGGGATLAYLSGKKLPGLTALYGDHPNK